MHGDEWLDDIIGGDSDVKTEPEADQESVKSGRPVHAHQWGGTERKVDPFLAETLSEEERALSATDDMTPEEDAELRKHEESLNGKGKVFKAPPMPSKPPTVHEHTHEGAMQASEGDEGDEVNEENPKALAKAASAFKTAIVKAKPVVAKTEAAVNPKGGGKWTILWSGAAGWLIGPDAVLAAYDRVLSMAGDFMMKMPRGEYLAAGGDPQDFNFTHGLVSVVREYAGVVYEQGQLHRALIAVALGVLPQIIASIPWRYASWAAGLAAAGYVAFGWYPQWWEVYATGLAAASYYGWMMAKRFSGIPEDEKKAWHDVVAFMCRIPMVSAIAGVITYSPGAIF